MYCMSVLRMFSSEAPALTRYLAVCEIMCLSFAHKIQYMSELDALKIIIDTHTVTFTKLSSYILCNAQYSYIYQYNDGKHRQIRCTCVLYILYSVYSVYCIHVCLLCIFLSWFLLEIPWSVENFIPAQMEQHLLLWPRVEHVSFGAILTLVPWQFLDF